MGVDKLKKTEELKKGDCASRQVHRVVIDGSINIQDAIAIAIKEKKIVSFESTKSNKDLRKTLSSIDMKGCKFYKSSPESDTVNVCTQSIYDLIMG